MKALTHNTNIFSLQINFVLNAILTNHTSFACIGYV